MQQSWTNYNLDHLFSLHFWWTAPCLSKKTAKKIVWKSSKTKQIIQYDLRSHATFIRMTATVGGFFVVLAATFGCDLTQTCCCFKLRATSNSLLSCNMIRFQEEFDKYLWVQHNSFANQIERFVARSPNSIHVYCCWKGIYHRNTFVVPFEKGDLCNSRWSLNCRFVQNNSLVFDYQKPDHCSIQSLSHHILLHHNAVESIDFHQDRKHGTFHQNLMPYLDIGPPPVAAQHFWNFASLTTNQPDNSVSLPRPCGCLQT